MVYLMGLLTTTIAQGTVIVPGSGHSHDATRGQMDFFAGDDGIHTNFPKEGYLDLKSRAL